MVRWRAAGGPIGVDYGHEPDSTVTHRIRVCQAEQRRLAYQ